jgi:DUF2075 family protein
MTAFYFDKIENFLAKKTDEIVGILSEKQTKTIDLNPKQNDSWRLQIDLFKENFKKIENIKESSILIEYPLLRLSKRLDTIIIVKNLIFLIEFKKSNEFVSSDKKQVEDYATNLKYFHKDSDGRLIIPILFASNAEKRENTYDVNENIAKTLYANGKNLNEIISEALIKFRNDSSLIDPEKWNMSDYCPVPNIIEAASLLFSGHNVREIASSKSSTKNIVETTETLIEIINYTKKNKAKSICFVTGVPGSGKTLTGLNAIHDERFQNEIKGIYLTGNLPLAKVLIESLWKSYAKQNDLNKEKSVNALKSRIQTVNNFLQEYQTRSESPPHENVVVFDEAQRAWDASKGKSKFDYEISEPEMFLQLMERHDDWAVIIALVGNGQEINTGERGLIDWGNSLNERAKNKEKKWKIYISPEMLNKSSDFTFSKLVEADSEKNLDLIQNKFLNLPVSVRAIQNEKAIDFINLILDEKHNEIKASETKSLPIYLTRSLEKMRSHLKNKVIGTQRCGLISSSDAVNRLRPYGLGVSLYANTSSEFINYYLDDVENYKSSNSLETTVNEYTCQGLELDYSGVCWGFDFTWSNKENSWTYRKSRGNGWQNVHKEDVKQFLKNRYRVLLTRFRHGMVIWVPEGNDKDRTRPKKMIDDTYDLLRNFGLNEL